MNHHSWNLTQRTPRQSLPFKLLGLSIGKRLSDDETKLLALTLDQRRASAGAQTARVFLTQTGYTRAQLAKARAFAQAVARELYPAPMEESEFATVLGRLIASVSVTLLTARAA